MKNLLSLVILSFLAIACNSSGVSGIDFCQYATTKVRQGILRFEGNTVDSCVVASVEENKKWSEEVRMIEPNSKVKIFVSNLDLVVNGKPMKRVLTAEVLEKDVRVISNEEVE